MSTAAQFDPGRRGAQGLPGRPDRVHHGLLAPGRIAEIRQQALARGAYHVAVMRQQQGVERFQRRTNPLPLFFDVQVFGCPQIADHQHQPATLLAQSGGGGRRAVGPLHAVIARAFELFADFGQRRPGGVAVGFFQELFHAAIVFFGTCRLAGQQQGPQKHRIQGLVRRGEVQQPPHLADPALRFARLPQIFVEALDRGARMRPQDVALLSYPGLQAGQAFGHRVGGEEMPLVQFQARQLAVGKVQGILRAGFGRSDERGSERGVFGSDPEEIGMAAIVDPESDVAGRRLQVFGEGVAQVAADLEQALTQIDAGVVGIEFGPEEFGQFAARDTAGALGDQIDQEQSGLGPGQGRNLAVVHADPLGPERRDLQLRQGLSPVPITGHSDHTSVGRGAECPLENQGWAGWCQSMRMVLYPCRS